MFRPESKKLSPNFAGANDAIPTAGLGCSRGNDYRRPERGNHLHRLRRAATRTQECSETTALHTTNRTPGKRRTGSAGLVRFVGSGPRVSRLTPRFSKDLLSETPCMPTSTCVRMIGRRRLAALAVRSPRPGHRCGLVPNRHWSGVRHVPRTSMGNVGKTAPMRVLCIASSRPCSSTHFPYYVIRRKTIPIGWYIFHVHDCDLQFARHIRIDRPMVL